MPMLASVSDDIFRITKPEGGFFAPQWNNNFLKRLQPDEDALALETVITNDGVKFFVRTRLEGGSVRSHLRETFGPAQKPGQRDWLQLRQGEDASVCTLYLTAHAVLPTVSYPQREIMRGWEAILAQARQDGDDFAHRLGVRILLQQAQHDWRQQFSQHFRSQQDSGGSGIKRLLRAPEPKSAAAEIDPELVAEKAAGPVFSCEVQIVVIYQSGSAKKRRAKVVLDRVTESAVNLLGGGKIWKRTATENVSGAKIFEGRNYLSGLLPWRVMECRAPAGSNRYALSPREVAPLWPTPQAMPKPAPVETVPTPDAAPEPRPVAPRVKASRAAESADGEKKRVAVAPRPAAEQGKTISPQTPSPDGGRASCHSAQPPELIVIRGLNRKNPTGNSPRLSKDTARHRAVINAARASTARDLDLSERDLVMVDQMGDMPLGTIQDLAYAFGWSPTTCYQALPTLKQKRVMQSAKLNTGGAWEEKFWVPEEPWSRIMDDRPLPHTAGMISWLWLNPRLVTAVYRAAGMAVRAVPERKLLALRWLRSRPFDAVAQYSDGWVVFMWSGIWQDREHLEERLGKCVLEFNQHWSGGRGAHWPGRIVFVAPHAWQAERVWRTVAGSVLEGSCAVYDVQGDTLTGDLDLRSSRGRIPPHIHENPSPPRADVDRWIDLLANDTAGHMTRLLFAIEQHPGIIPSHMGTLTRISGKNVKAGLHQLLQRKLIYEMPDGGYALNPWSLAMAARRDRVWVGRPNRRLGPDKVAAYSDRRLKRIHGVQRLLSKCAAAGCSVAPGWQALDGGFRPDGVVWITDGPYGPGWHYVVYVVHAKKMSSVKRALQATLSDTRTDDYPVLVVCHPQMERVIWSLAGDKPILTATNARVRTGPVVGRDGTVWLQFGISVQVLAGPTRELPQKDDQEDDHD